jgi:hypothetical protein
MESIDTASNLPEFFCRHIRDAIRNQRVDASPEAEFYLVALLSRFAKADPVYSHDEALVHLLENALEADRETRITIFKHLGDLALYVAGYFPESLSRKLVDIDYYVQMGGCAYNSISTLHARPTIQALFQELSDKFTLWTNILSEVSAKGRCHTSEQDLLKIYESWQRTGSRLAQVLLEREGIIPHSGSHESN